MEELYEKRMRALRAYYVRHKKMPSLSEMLELFRVKSKNTARHTSQKLIAAGYLRQNEKGKISPTKKLLGIPLLGDVQAGWPSPAEEELRDRITLDDYLVRNKNSTFIVEAQGDSMNKAGIISRDLILVEQGRSPRDGDIVIASVDNEFTLKRYIRDGRNAYLTPESYNTSYKRKKVDSSVQIHSVVVGSVRRYT